MLLALIFALPPASLADEGQVARHVSVVGAATVEARPDRATVHLSVVRVAPQVTDATAAVGEVVGQFLELCDSLDIAREDLRTAGVRVQPQYRHQRVASAEPEITGYRASRDLTVMLDDLEVLGPLIERALALGANQASPPGFSVSNEDELRMEALALAARSARERASVLASTLDASLGAVREISTDDVSVRPPRLEAYARAAMASDSAEQSYEPGKVTIDVRVRAVFDLLTADDHDAHDDD